MILDRIEEFGNTLVERAKNPFGGTLIVAWAIQNWELVYVIFNFDEATLLTGRIQTIKDYVSDAGACRLLWLPILYAFIAIISFLVLSTVSLMFFTLSSKWLKPFVFWLVDRNKLSTKEREQELLLMYNRMRKANETLQEEQRKEAAKIKELEATNATLGSHLSAKERELKDVEEKRSQEVRDLMSAYSKELVEEKEHVESLRSEVNSLKNLLAGTQSPCELFDGTWKNMWQTKSGNKGHEYFTIDINNQYLVNGQPAYSLHDFRYDSKQKALSFRKKRISDGQR